MTLIGFHGFDAGPTEAERRRLDASSHLPSRQPRAKALGQTIGASVGNVGWFALAFGIGLIAASLLAGGRRRS